MPPRVGCSSAPTSRPIALTPSSFPVVYLVIALPLIVYRLGILNGKEWDWKFLSASGTIFSLLGLADVILCASPPYYPR